MRKPDPVEVIAIAVPVLLEAVCVFITISGAIVAVALYATRVPV